MDGFLAVLGGLRAVRRRARSRCSGVDRNHVNYPRLSRKLQLEPLEDRALLSVGMPIGPSLPGTSVATTTGAAATVPLTSHYDHIAKPVSSGDIVPMSPTQGMSPSQVRTAYGLNPPITVGGVTGDGTGQTIAIVDAYKDTHIASDLATFDSTFGIPAPPNFLVLNQSGGTNLNGVGTDSGWETEIALDVEWAHAMAPAANIVLFEANNSLNINLYAAISTARTYTNAQFPDISVLSMSWGGGEWSGETGYDTTYFTTPSLHTGITFVASTGDSGAPPEYPSISPNVLAIGGTTLDIKDSSGTYNTESGWSGSGGGISSYEPRPAYQSALQSNSQREAPDVSLDASDASSVQVYDGGWYYVWGTSVSAPCWGGMIAIANQFRMNATPSLGTLNPSGNPTQTQTLLYGFAGSTANFNPFGLYHDVTTGGSTGSPNYSCVNGYDMATGIGTPLANLLLPALTYGVAPGIPDLAANYDTGISNTDNITYLNNHNTLSELQFTVANTISGATVTIYSDGTAIGSATASGATTTVTTSGSFTLTDGNHSITARQTISGLEQSLDSTALTITIDTTPPTVTVNQATGQADPVRLGATINFTALFSEQVFGLVATGVTLGGTAGETTVVVTNPSNDHITYNLAVSGMTQTGTVIVSLAAGVAEDTAGNVNVASTSTDNTVTVVATTRTWTGGGADNNWTTAANWANGVAPIAGDALVFAGSTRTSPYDNFGRGTIFDSITFANGGFTLSGGTVKLTPAGGVAITNVAGQNEINLAIASNSTGNVVVQAGALRLGLNAWSPVLNGSGVDIQAGKLIFDYTGVSTPAATILSLLTASYDGGAWDTGKFRSTTAVANATTLGWMDDTVNSLVTVMDTIPGDFNLDGTVDSADYSIWFANAWTGTTWAQGDANYDGSVDGLDRDILLANLSRSVSGSPLPSPVVSQADTTAVNAGMGVSLSGGSKTDGPTSSLPASHAKPASMPDRANTSDVSATNVALQTAHDAVFTRLATAPGGIVDGVLGDGGLDAGLALAELGVSGVPMFP